VLGSASKSMSGVSPHAKITHRPTLSLFPPPNRMELHTQHPAPLAQTRRSRGASSVSSTFNSETPRERLYGRILTAFKFSKAQKR
jgi:hypothetical protein